MRFAPPATGHKWKKQSRRWSTYILVFFVTVFLFAFLKFGLSAFRLRILLLHFLLAGLAVAAIELFINFLLHRVGPQALFS